LDALWQVFGENPWMLGVTVAGLLGVVAGPWAIIKAVSRPPRANAEE
jgi:hypothetical protein